MNRLRAFFVLFLATAGMLRAQTYTQGYTQIVIFGDSLSDTGNFAQTVQNTFVVRIPGPLTSDYTDGRFTDGKDTSPAARLYTGVWAEQLAAGLTPVVTVQASLNGGTDYAYGSATNQAGTQLVNVTTGVNVTVQNVGAQIAAYLATKPVITAKTLFVVWGGANDLLQATTSAQVTAAATAEVSNVQTLMAAGATQFVVPNLPPLGLIPRLNGMAVTSAQASGLAALYNGVLAPQLQALMTTSAIKIYQLDVYSLFQAVVASPAVSGLANVTASSQGNTTVNPDTYLFWDDLHPTTYGHALIAKAARNLLTETLPSATTLTASASVATPGQVVTLTAKSAVSGVVGNSSIPTGLTTFYSGSTPIATAAADGTGTATTTVTAALAASPYTFAAKYAGDATFLTSTSGNVTVVAANPGYTFTASPTTVTVVHGAAGSTVLTLTPTGNLSGTYTPSCGMLPAYVTCTFSAASLTAANNTAVTETLSFGTSVTAAAVIPAWPGSRAGSASGLQVFTAFTLLGGLALAGLRRRGVGSRLRPGLLGLVALLMLGGSAGLVGCSGGGNSGPTTHTAAAGTYTIPVTLTPAVSGSTNTLNITLVVQ